MHKLFRVGNEGQIATRPAFHYSVNKCNHYMLKTVQNHNNTILKLERCTK